MVKSTGLYEIRTESNTYFCEIIDAKIRNNGLDIEFNSIQKINRQYPSITNIHLKNGTEIEFENIEGAVTIKVEGIEQEIIVECRDITFLQKR